MDKIDREHKKAVLPAKLLLEDGTSWDGESFGAPISAAGELVFTTGMVGYTESLTDPSYKGQLLMCTYPLIGNYGVPRQDSSYEPWGAFESDRIQVSGLIVSSYSAHWNHWKATRSLGEWLTEEGIPAITGIDTRRLTQHLREKGTMLARLEIPRKPWRSSSHEHPVAEVSCSEPYVCGSGSKRVVLIDCGVKKNIIRRLVAHDCTVHVVPWDYPLSSLSFDGVVLSNGPGDPRWCTKTIENIAPLLSQNIPMLGICLGHQLLGLAAGAELFKMKYGHRGQNQPVIEKGTNRCFITAQNHGYALDIKTLPPNWDCWFENLNDHTCEGIIHSSKRYRGVQFHPEASPGPSDTDFLFADFCALLGARQ